MDELDEHFEPLMRDDSKDLRDKIICLKNENQMLLNKLCDMKYAFALSELKNYKEKETNNLSAMPLKGTVANDDGVAVDGDGNGAAIYEDEDVLSPIGEKESLDHLMHRLEMEGMGKVQTLVNRDLKIDSLIQIMEDGEKEFMANTGRHMTYGEMRSIYG